MSKYVIAIESGDIRQYLGEDAEIRRFNSKTVDYLQSAAINLGFPKKLKLDFIIVGFEQARLICDPAHRTLQQLKTGAALKAVIGFNGDDVERVYKEINQRYPDRMDREEYKKYKAEIIEAMAKIMCPLSKYEKPARPGNPGLRVGDFLEVHRFHRCTNPARITKITAAGYQYEILSPVIRPSRDGSGIENFKDAQHSGNDWDGSISIPYLGNEHLFHVAKKVRVNFGSHSDEPVLAPEYSNYWYTD
jgi:hypothetical protein